MHGEELVESEHSWNKCAEYIAEAWKALIEALNLLGTKGAGTIAPELVDKAMKFWVLKDVLLAKFNLVEESGAETPALVAADAGKKPVAIIVTPKAMKSKRELIESLLHEILHAAGFLSDDVEMDEMMTDELTKDLIEEIMKQEPITRLPEPPKCEAEETIKTGGSDEELRNLIQSRISEIIIVNADALGKYLDDVTDPKKWFDGLTKKVIELNNIIDELLALAKALREVYNEQSIRDIDDPELAERFKTILVGGIDPNESTNEKALAPLLWKLFGIKIIPATKETTPIIKLESHEQDTDAYVKILKKYKIDRVYVRIGDGLLEQAIKRIKKALHDYLNTIGEEYMNTKPYTDNQKYGTPEALIIKYIPPPGQNPDELFKLFEKMFKLIYEVAPGLNPYVTFALSVSPVYLADLAEILRIDLEKAGESDIEKMRKIVNLLGFNRALLLCHIANRCKAKMIPEDIINAIKSGDNCPISKYADDIVLIHETIHDYGKGFSIDIEPWPIALIDAILSSEYRKLENTLLNSTVLSPSTLTATYLQERLKEAVYGLRTPLENSKSLICTGVQEFVRSAKHIPSMCEVLDVLTELPLVTLYSPGLIVYVRIETVSVLSTGEKRYAVRLCRVRIPGEEQLLKEVCESEGQ